MWPLCFIEISFTSISILAQLHVTPKQSVQLHLLQWPVDLKIYNQNFGSNTLAPSWIHPFLLSWNVMHIPKERLSRAIPCALTLLGATSTSTPHPSKHTHPNTPHPSLYPPTTHSHTSPLFMNNPGGLTAHCAQLCGGKMLEQKTGSSQSSPSLVGSDEKTMVTSVSTDRGRMQRLECKSHIPAPCSMPLSHCCPAKYQSREPCLLEQRKLNSACCITTHGMEVELSNGAVHPLSPTEGLKTLFNPIKRWVL